MANFVEGFRFRDLEGMEILVKRGFEEKKEETVNLLIFL